MIRIDVSSFTQLYRARTDTVPSAQQIAWALAEAYPPASLPVLYEYIVTDEATNKVVGAGEFILAWHNRRVRAFKVHRWVYADGDTPKERGTGKVVNPDTLTPLPKPRKKIELMWY